jgi:putative acetyltransferase
VLIRRETPSDADAIRAVTSAAFASADQPDRTPVEPGLIDELRAGRAWLPSLSLVAMGSDGGADEVIGHVVCTRGHLGSAPALGLGPLSVRTDQQRRGVGSALMHAVLGAADALGEPLVALLGDPGYYHRFGFRLSAEYSIKPPVPEWHPYFQVRALAAYQPSLQGTFVYAEAFDALTLG